MQLTRHTDYALRLLIDLAGSGGARCQIADIARRQAISRTHLMKIASELARAGLIEAVRGRGGGIRLSRPPSDILLSDVIDVTEPTCALVDCSSCRLVRNCDLPSVLNQAMAAFRAILTDHTLADVLGQRTAAVE